jgi:hypothetical protein
MDFLFGIFSYPFFLFITLMEKVASIIFTPIIMSYTQMKGINLWKVNGIITFEKCENMLEKLQSNK